MSPIQMLLKELQIIFHETLGNGYPKEEVDSFFHLIVEHHLGQPRFVLALKPGFTVDKVEQQFFFEALEALKQQRPIQYILGKTEFMGLDFEVNPHVLIPRPETEELVQWVLNEFSVQHSAFDILDIGTGSGCIAVALAKNLPSSSVHAIDISKKALDVAKKNALLNNVHIDFYIHDILNLNLNLNLSLEFDIVVSNPPYVRESEKVMMHDNVKKYEPETALFVSDDDPLQFYRAIVAFTKKHLKAGGLIFLEINQYMAEETRQLLVDNGFLDVVLRKDIFGNFRLLKGTKK